RSIELESGTLCSGERRTKLRKCFSSSGLPYSYVHVLPTVNLWKRSKSITLPRRDKRECIRTVKQMVVSLQGKSRFSRFGVLILSFSLFLPCTSLVSLAPSLACTYPPLAKAVP